MKNLIMISTGVILLGMFILTNFSYSNSNRFEAPSFQNLKALEMPTFVIHRGVILPNTENTLEAITQSLNRFPEAYIEIDVCETTDGRLVFLHSPKDCNRNVLDDKTAHLEEILDLFNHYPKARLQIDSKLERRSGYSTLAQMILSRDLTKQTIITSSDYALLQAFHIVYPDLNLGLDSGSIGRLNEQKVSEIIIHAKDINANVVFLDYGLFLGLTPEQIRQLVDLFHNENIVVNVWTVDDAKIFLWILQWKVDRVTTNRIDVLLSIIKTNQVPGILIAGFAS